MHWFNKREVSLLSNATSTENVDVVRRCDDESVAQPNMINLGIIHGRFSSPEIFLFPPFRHVPPTSFYEKLSHQIQCWLRGNCGRAFI